MFDDQHDCQASVGSKCFALQPARMMSRCLPQEVFILSALLLKETVFLLSECRDKHPSGKSSLTSVRVPSWDCPDPEIVDQEWEFFVSLWLGYGRVCGACSRGDPLLPVLFSNRSVVSA